VADAEDPKPDVDADATTCLPCRGTGAVVSFLGGDASSVPCPWCEGTGERHPGVDAQARWRELSAAEGDAGGAGAEPDAPAETAAPAA
jgi:hypothetical protein